MTAQVGNTGIHARAAILGFTCRTACPAKKDAREQESGREMARKIGQEGSQAAWHAQLEQVMLANMRNILAEFTKCWTS